MSMISADKLSNSEYHAKKDYISSSDVKMVHSKSLAHWKAKTYSSSPVFDMGTAVHAMVLEDGKGIIRGPETRRGKAWTEAYEEAQATQIFGLRNGLIHKLLAKGVVTLAFDFPLHALRAVRAFVV